MVKVSSFKDAVSSQEGFWWYNDNGKWVRLAKTGMCGSGAIRNVARVSRHGPPAQSAHH
jgi:hypothetical protein